MSRAEAKAHTRAQLLDSAREVFAEKGYSAASVEEIAARAGFTRGAFYANFADKAAVLWDLAEDEQRRAFEALGEGLLAVPLEEKMGVLQAWFDRRLTTRPLERAVGELIHHVGRTDAGRARMARIFAAERDAVAQVVDAICEALDVDLPIDRKHFAAMGFALGNGLFQQHLADPAAVPQTLFGDGLAYLWFGVLAVASGQMTGFTPATE